MAGVKENCFKGVGKLLPESCVNSSAVAFMGHLLMLVWAFGGAAV